MKVFLGLLDFDKHKRRYQQASHNRFHIQVSTATAQLIRDHYTLESRGPVPIKGIGEVETFLIV
jgi:hypothetical protein